MYVSVGFKEDVVRSALAYEPCPGDVFIVSYPKCGTTWMQHIVYYIYSRGKPPKDSTEFTIKTPFLEFLGVDAAIHLPRPAAMKTHMPFHKQPFASHAKYIYITRNPYDCCVSFYYHTKNLPEYHFENGTFDEFFEFFLKGQVDFGDYFTHLLSWYNNRDRPNILFLTYEDLKANTRSWIQMIADFLGEEFGSQLRQDSALLDTIMERTSLNHMKAFVNKQMTANIGNDLLATPVEDLPPSLATGLKDLDETLKKPMTGDFVRKGVVGDWRNHFSPEQARRMKEWIAQRTVGSDVMNLWTHIDLDI